MIEHESPGELAAFQEEIAKIAEKAKVISGDAGAVLDVKEIEKADMDIWHECLEILSVIDNLDPQGNKDEIVKQLLDLRDKAEALGEKTKAANTNSENKGKNSKLAFNAWLGNMNPFMFVDSALEMNSQDGVVDDVKQLVKDVKKFTAERREIYLHKGWEKIEPKK